jgi:hypothetical protein
VALIHVPKAAGTTVKDMLNKAGVAYTTIHEAHSLGRDGDDPSPTSSFPAAAALDCAHTLYISVTRDPVARAVSAFNFVKAEAPYAEHELPFLSKLFVECFPQVPGGASAFGEALGQDSECGQLARAALHEPGSMNSWHVGKGHAYYLRDTGLLEVLRRPDKSSYVVRTEALQADAVGMLEWLCVPSSLAEAIWQEAEEEAGTTGQRGSNGGDGDAIMADKNLTDEARVQLALHLQPDAYAKATAEALADNAPSALAAEWARPPPQEAQALECTRACGLVSDFDVRDAAADTAPCPVAQPLWSSMLLSAVVGAALGTATFLMCVRLQCRGWLSMKGGAEGEQGYDMRPNNGVLVAS